MCAWCIEKLSRALAVANKAKQAKAARRTQSGRPRSRPAAEWQQRAVR